MNEPVFDHERLDVYRLSIEYVASSYRIAKTLSGMNRPARDQWLRAAQSIPRNIAEGNGKRSLKDKNRFFEIARGSARECASIHDVPVGCDAIDVESNGRGNFDLKRIVSMLTRLIQRTEAASEGSIEYEYRDAEYEYEEMPEQRNPPEPPVGSSLVENLTRRPRSFQSIVPGSEWTRCLYSERYGATPLDDETELQMLPSRSVVMSPVELTLQTNAGPIF